MSDTSKPAIGSVGWTDLTVVNAEQVRDFYSAVVGWKPEPVAMGDYSDFTMVTPGEGKGVAGICHARGMNANLPPQWLIYIAVEDLQKSVKSVLKLGGKILVQPKDMGSYGAYCVIEDPAGAVAALIQPK